jgi:uncharacterized protein (TIRG00374 family)
MLSRRAIWFNAAMLLLGLGMLAILLMRLGVEQVTVQLEAAGWALVGAFLLSLLRWLAMTGAWRTLINATGARVSLRDLYPAFLTGQAINFLTPTGGLGEVVKATMVRPTVDGQRAAVSLVALNLLEAVPIQALNLLVPLGCLLFTDLPADLLLLLLGLGMLFCLPIGLLCLLVRPRPAKRITFVLARLFGKRGQGLEAWLAKAGAMAGQLEDLWHPGTGRTAVLRSLALMFVGRAIELLEVTLLLMILRPAVSPGVQIALSALSLSVGKMLSWVAMFIPGQVGLSEGSGALLFKWVGLDPILGFSFELLKRLRTLGGVAIGLFLGLGVMLRRAKVRPVTVRTARQASQSVRGTVVSHSQV